MIDKHEALTATQNDAEKIDPEEPLPDQPDPELPDLTRLYKRRCRDGNVMQRCKHMLIAGYSPGRVALLLRMPLEKVKELHQASYNPRCRCFANPNNGKLIITMWPEKLRANRGLFRSILFAALEKANKPQQRARPRRPESSSIEPHRHFTLPAHHLAGVLLRP